ncbi:protein kinase domain-containing protein [Thioflexithrix psekupsensis]|uniref:Protein kinase domain-containing protein n=3 Tax=Thioflexithrix psekupsensis TaxID=1570016 RepID=A0A251XC20_9GAMM|nr:protein kinase [Thioflexithrix psekupsensis]OUD16067.1 hypothetical protein TPSD3_01285 [Thioflexithrix psekupsensis]
MLMIYHTADHGDFQVIRQLGEGGSGSLVYEVSAVADSHQRFALKHLCKLKRSEHEMQFRRFENEMRFAAKHTHDHLLRAVTTDFVTVDGEAQPFYVMPLYPKTLKDLIAEDLAHDRVLPLFHQLLDGVEYLNQFAFVHRDLKPENIFYDAVNDRLIIADFGITDFTASADFALVETEVGVRLMSARYGSPEQVHMGYKPHPFFRDSGEIGLAADIYALGAILHEMFTREMMSSPNAYDSIVEYVIYQMYRSIFGDLPYLDLDGLIMDFTVMRKRLTIKGKYVRVFDWIEQVKANYGYLDELCRLMTIKNVHRRIATIKDIRCFLETRDRFC